MCLKKWTSSLPMVLSFPHYKLSKSSVLRRKEAIVRSNDLFEMAGSLGQFHPALKLCSSVYLRSSGSSLPGIFPTQLNSSQKLTQVCIGEGSENRRMLSCKGRCGYVICLEAAKRNAAEGSVRTITDLCRNRNANKFLHFSSV